MTRLRKAIEENSLFRMIGWLPVGLMFYAISMQVGADAPQVQLLAWKLGHACTFSWVGYWIARQVSGRLQDVGQVNTTWEAIIYAARILARAILVYGALQVSSGL